MVKFISINYNTCIVMYGTENRLLSEGQTIVKDVYSAIEKELEGQCMMFVEAFEMLIDPKNNTEKRQSLVRVPIQPESKQATPDLVRVLSLDDLTAVMQHIQSNQT